MSNFEFKHDVGYRGVCIFNTGVSSQELMLLCTGGNIALTQDPIMGSGVWGAGYKVAGSIAYAWNYLQLEGSANFELTTRTNELSYLFKFIENSKKNDNDNVPKVTLLPDGVNGFTGGGRCTSMSFDASEGSALTGTFNFKGNPGPRENDPSSIKYSSAAPSGSGAASLTLLSSGITNSSLVGAVLMPYWKTNVLYNTDNSETSYFKKDTKLASIDDVISWNCSYNCDMQLLSLCNYDNSHPSAPTNADYILLGEISTDASYTLFRLRGKFDPNEFHSPTNGLGFLLDNQEIVLPLVVINNASTSMTTGASYITAEFSFNGLSNGEQDMFLLRGHVK